jgi:type IV fimbrial biogenesis protein FimT
MKTSPLRAHAGFTMIEMLVAMCVVAILIALAGPFLTNMGAAQQVRSASYDVYSTLTQARSEALTRNTLVTVSPISGDWAQGWTVTQADGTVLRRQSAYPRIALTGPAQIIYSGEGRPSTTATPFLFSASNVTTDAWRCLRVRLNGRASISRGPCP